MTDLRAVLTRLDRLEARLAQRTPDALVGPAEAAMILGVSRATFERMRKRGAVPEPRIRHGRTLRWRVGDLTRAP